MNLQFVWNLFPGFCSQGKPTYPALSQIILLYLLDIPTASMMLLPKHISPPCVHAGMQRPMDLESSPPFLYHVLPPMFRRRGYEANPNSSLIQLIFGSFNRITRAVP